MAIFLVPQEKQRLIGGHAGFQDRGIAGQGVPGYLGMRGYAGFDVPTPIGARYFPPDPDFDPDTDQPIPLALGYKMNGGREAYRERVWRAAKKGGRQAYRKLGFSTRDIEKVLGPKGYLPDWRVTPRSVRGGNVDFNDPFLEAVGRERPDYTSFTFPAANLADAASEEIELDQALSLAGRFGREFLGAQVGSLIDNFLAEHLTIGTADHRMDVQLFLNTRTGTFGFEDPEQLWSWHMGQAITAPTTATSQEMQLAKESMRFGEPELYVAPRLFWRLTNNIDATITANDVGARLASVSIRLTFRLFVELLERFADVTLL